MHFRDLEHTAVCISCVGCTEDRIIEGNLEVSWKILEVGRTGAVSLCLILWSNDSVSAEFAVVLFFLRKMHEKWAASLSSDHCSMRSQCFFHGGCNLLDLHGEAAVCLLCAPFFSLHFCLAHSWGRYGLLETQPSVCISNAFKTWAFLNATRVLSASWGGSFCGERPPSA